jgi:hypothetical protein
MSDKVRQWFQSEQEKLSKAAAPINNRAIIDFVDGYGIAQDFDGDDAFDMIRAWENRPTK